MKILRLGIKKKSRPMEYLSILNAAKTEIFKGKVDMDESGHIIADEDMVTNIPGFAAGDVRSKSEADCYCGWGWGNSRNHGRKVYSWTIEVL